MSESRAQNSAQSVCRVEIVPVPTRWDFASLPNGVKLLPVLFVWQLTQLKLAPLGMSFTRNVRAFALPAKPASATHDAAIAPDLARLRPPTTTLALRRRSRAARPR